MCFWLGYELAREDPTNLDVFIKCNQIHSGGGGITVRLMENESEVAVAVADTDTGILADELPFIFDRFWRADKVRSRDAAGSGLGLAIAREIAQRHRAELTVEAPLGTDPRLRFGFRAILASGRRYARRMSNRFSPKLF
jgi:signal transduction histidine kinase